MNFFLRYFLDIISSLENSKLRSQAQFLDGSAYFSRSLSYLYILDINLLFNVNDSLPLCWIPLHSIVSLSVQRFF